MTVSICPGHCGAERVEEMEDRPGFQEAHSLGGQRG